MAALRIFLVIIFPLACACAPKPAPESTATETVEEPANIDPVAQARPGAEPWCASAKECVVLDNDCGNTKVVHRDSEASMMFGSEHGECVPVRAKAMVLECVGRKCRGQNVGYEELRDGCSNANQCEVVASICSSWEVVASANAEKAKAYFAEQAQSVKCSVPDVLPKKPEVACVNRFCVPTTLN